MKYRTVIFFTGCLLIFSACKNHQQSGPDISNRFQIDSTAKDSATDKFFPIADYLQSEIRYVDSTPLAVLKCVTFHNRTDSSFLTPKEFNIEASAFLVPELDPDTLQKNYTENSFSDKTTGYLTFTYSPRDREAPLHRVDVLISPGRGSTQQVKSIYLERTSSRQDTLVTQKMYWQTRRGLLVITSLQPKGKTAEVRQTKVVWNNDEAD